jgi:subtilisin family serine protease
VVTLSSAPALGPAAGAALATRRALVARAVLGGSGALRSLVAWLEAHGGTDIVPLPIAGAVAVTLSVTLIPEVAALPGVVRVAPDAPITAPVGTAGAPAAPGWNLAAIRAPAVWALGHHGAGVVVAVMDTGVDVRHPDLGPRWRGGPGGWFDPFLGTTAPYDAIGHGTQAMGILAGGATRGAAVGVAPEAAWIAAKIYDDRGATTVSVVHRAFQWLLDPDGDPSTADAPDVVSVSWGDGVAGQCDPTFQRDLDALRAAGILVVLAAGNSGPAPGSSMSPANAPGALSVGAVDAARTAAPFSSRGPSACGGDPFPSLVAPGVDVPTTDVSLAGVPVYTTVSGTSFAAPHVAGAAALLWGALVTPGPEAVAAALRSSAVDLGPPGPDPTYGAGLVDALGALTAAPPGAVRALSAARSIP